VRLGELLPEEYDQDALEEEEAEKKRLREARAVKLARQREDAEAEQKAATLARHRERRRVQVEEQGLEAIVARVAARWERTDSRNQNLLGATRSGPDVLTPVRLRMDRLFASARSAYLGTLAPWYLCDPEGVPRRTGSRSCLGLDTTISTDPSIVRTISGRVVARSHNGARQPGSARVPPPAEPVDRLAGFNPTDPADGVDPTGPPADSIKLDEIYAFYGRCARTRAARRSPSSACACTDNHVLPGTRRPS
jgi:hypothetical protein